MTRILIIIGAVLSAMLVLGCASPASEINKPQAPAVQPSAQPPSVPPAPLEPQAELPQTELKMTITEPADDSIVSNSMVVIRGKTSPGAVVSINGEITGADSQGNFMITVSLEEGPNIIEVIASDEYGSEVASTLTIILIKGG